jgi:hypothetical protein
MEAIDKESLDALPIQEPEQEFERSYSWREKALRDLFVKEYLVDYDSIGAAMRVGYNRGIAKEYAVRLMDEPYVMRQIAKYEGAPVEEDETTAKKRIMAGLVREANFRGAGSSQAARVAALGKLAQLYGMEPATRNKTELTGADGQPLAAGQFVIPGIMTPEQWEPFAAQQQADLVAGKTKQVDQVEPPSVN